MGINGSMVVYTRDDGTYKQIEELAGEVGFATRREIIGQFEAILDPTVRLVRNGEDHSQEYVRDGVYRFFARESERQKTASS